MASKTSATTATAALLALSIGLSSIQTNTLVNAALAEPPAGKFVIGEFAHSFARTCLCATIVFPLDFQPAPPRRSLESKSGGGNSA